MSARPHDLACVIVNYNSGVLCASAVRSLQQQRIPAKEGRERSQQGGTQQAGTQQRGTQQGGTQEAETGPEGTRPEGTLQIVIVDNDSPTDQHAFLDPLSAQGDGSPGNPRCDVIYHDTNDGYGRGMNLGMKSVDADCVLLMNPDVLALPGSLAAMVDRLRSDETVGAVGPRGYLDAECFVMLPPNDLPSLSLHGWESLGRVYRRVARFASKRRTRRFLRAWRSPVPLDMEMISGFAMAFRTEVARELGPFDPEFPFYFEDADLCRRVRKAGYRLVLDPASEMIHFFDQSARQFREEVLRKYEASRTYYYRKNYGGIGMRAFDALQGFAAKRADERMGWRFHEPEDLGECGEEPLSLTLPKSGEWLMELATDPAFLFCGGHIGRGDQVTFPERTWGFLEAIRWYVRVLDPVDLTPLRYVTFQKTTPSCGPVSFEELSSDLVGGMGRTS